MKSHPPVTFKTILIGGVVALGLALSPALAAEVESPVNVGELGQSKRPAHFKATFMGKPDKGCPAGSFDG